MPSISVAVADIPLRNMAPLAAHIETAGFDGVFLGEHVLTPSAHLSTYPYAANAPVFDPISPRPEVLVTLGAMAAVTTRLRIGTAVLIAPLRHPVLLARAAATLQDLSGGRLVLGLGVGWLQEELAAFDVPFEQRGTYLDEMLDLLPRLWSGETVRHAGAAYDLPEVRVTPAVTAPIPLLVGGHSARALRRAAEADGWIGPPVALEETVVLTKRLTELRAEVRADAGTRAPFSMYVRLPLGADHAQVDEYRTLGFDDLVVSPFRGGGIAPTAPIDDIRHGLDALARRLGVTSGERSPLR